MSLAVMSATAHRHTSRWSNDLTSFGDDRPWTNYCCDGIPHNMVFCKILFSGFHISVTETRLEGAYSQTVYRTPVRHRAPRAIMVLSDDGDSRIAVISGNGEEQVTEDVPVGAVRIA